MKIRMRSFWVILISSLILFGFNNAWATDVTVKLQDSDGVLLGGGSLRFYDGSWKTATVTGTGTFLVSTSATSVTYEMTFNNGRQTLSNVPITTNPVIFQTVSVTPALKNSDDTELSGGTVRYHQITWADWTNANTSKELLPGPFTFEMTYNNGRQTKSNYNIPADASHEVLFQTVTVTPALQNSDGTTLSGGTVRYHQITWADWTNANTSKELLPGPFTFEMTYNNGRQTKSNYNIPADASHEVLFKTVTVTPALKNSGGTVLSGGTVRYHQITWADWADANTEKELLPGPFTFEMTYNNGKQTKSNYTIPADAAHEVLFQTVTVKPTLKTSDGTVLSGGTVRYHQITWANWTDANTEKELLAGPFTFEMTYNNGRQTKSNYNIPTGASHEVPFQTTTTTVRLERCDNTGLDGGVVRFHQITWQNFGTTSGGDAVLELLPGPFTFEMTFNNGRQTKSNENISGTAQTVLFQTTKVEFRYSGVVKYHQITWQDFIKPVMDLLPGNYTFSFDNYSTQVAVTGCSMSSSALVIKLLNSTNGGLADGEAQYYDSGWKPIGTTPANGIILFFIPGVKTNVSFRMTYAGAAQEKSQNIATNSQVVFQTARVTFNLKDSNGNPIPGAGTEYYASGWKTFGGGTTLATMELLPLNYSFRVSSNGASQEKSQNVGTDPNVIFQTVQVSFDLVDSGNNQIPGAGTQYYASGWKTFGGGSTLATMELLPLNYSFRVTHGGASQEKSQNVGTNPNVVFQTKLVTFQLKDSNGNLLAGAGTQYYASGWKTFGGGTTTATMELLPLNYSFRVTYAGASQEKSQNVGSDPTVIFQTTLVTFKLNDSFGTEITDAGTQYYASGWKTFGDDGKTTETMELLPLNYSFRVTYAGASQEKSQNVKDNPIVIFQTKQVTFKLNDSGGNPISDAGTQYYASGWKTFGGGTTTATMELLPLNYSFRVTHAGASQEKSQNVNNDPVVIFQTKLVTAKLLDASNNELAATVQYYASGWKTFGGGTTTATMELLPLKYSFRVTFGGASLEQSQDVNIDPVVIFRGTNVTLQFTGDIQYYASGWKTFTKPTIVLLPGKYTFRFSGTGYPAIEKQLEITGNEMKKSIGYLRLVNHSGVGIANGAAMFYQSGWKDAGTTNSQGVTIAVIDGLVGNTNFRMSHIGAAQEKSQNIASNSFVVFQTTLVTMKLVMADGTTELAGGADFYASGWKTFGGGTTTTTMELLPLSYSFRISCGGASQEKSQNVASNPLVQFQTKVVSFKLLAADGTTELEGGTEYYASGWKTFGGGKSTTTMELLPLSYSFRISFKGASQEKSQNVSSDPAVKFQTKVVTMKLVQSDGTTELAGGTEYYASGWKMFGGGTSTTTMELLPLSYGFRISYQGAAQEKNQNVATNDVVQFQTTLVSFALNNSGGSPITGAGAQYYASGWKTFGSGSTPASMELLPLSYGFRVSYVGASQEKNQNVSSNTNVVFQTAQVTVELKDGSGSGIGGGTAQYYASGWQTIGLTGSDGKIHTQLLPLTYTFRMSYSGASKEKNQAVTNPATVTFTYASGVLAKKNLLADGWVLEEGWTEPVPDQFMLQNCYPNPFNATTTILYQLAEDVDVKLIIYNIRGEIVRTLVDAHKAAGYYEAIWDGNNEQGLVVANGVYFYQLQAGQFKARKQMTVLK